MKSQQDNLIDKFQHIFASKIQSVDSDTILLFFEKLYEKKQVSFESCTYFFESLQILGQLSDDQINADIIKICKGLFLFCMIVIMQKEKCDQILTGFGQENFESVLLKVEQYLQTFGNICKNSKKIAVNFKGQIVNEFYLIFENFKAQKQYKKCFVYCLNINRLILEEKGIKQYLIDPQQIFNVYHNQIQFFYNKHQIKQSKLNTKIISTLLKICRNLIFQKIQAIENQFIDLCVKLLKEYLKEEQIQIDIIRILSKISEQENYGYYVADIKNIEDTLDVIFTNYQKSDYILSGYLQLMGNLLTWHQQFAQKIYSSDQMSKLLQLFEKYTNIKDGDLNNYEDMLKSFTNFEFLKRNEQEFVEKLVRIFANIFTYEQNAITFLQSNFQNYKKILKVLRIFLNEQQMQNETLILAILAFLTNIFYYENNVLLYNDFELKKLKLDLVKQVSFLIINPQNINVLVDGLRAIANLTKSKEISKYLIELNYQKALFILLEYNNDEVIYNSLGCIINLTNLEQFYNDENYENFFEALSKIESQNLETFLLINQACSNIFHFLKSKQKFQLNELNLNIIKNMIENSEQMINQQLTNKENSQQENYNIKKFEQLISSVKNNLKIFEPKKEEKETQKPKKFILKKKRGLKNH